MAAVEGFVLDPTDERGFEKIVAPGRWRTSLRFRGQLAARHAMGVAPGIACEISLWRRSPRGWVVGVTWSDGTETDARSEQVDTLDAAMTFVETEGRAAIDETPERQTSRGRGVDAAEALIRPFLRRRAAAELRQVYDELAGRALLDWQKALEPGAGAAR